VRDAAANLGYVPNAAARSLRAQRTHILGLLLDELADPVHGQLAAGVEAAAAERGLAVFIMTGLHAQEREVRALRAFLEHRTDGIILASTISDPADIRGRVASDRYVLVQPDYPRLAKAGPPDRGVIRSDDAAGMRAIVDHLAERGYRRLAYVGAGGGAEDVLRRRAAIDAADRAGLARPTLYDAGLEGWRDPAAIAAQLEENLPDAVMCFDDKLALALVDVLRTRGVEVPRDVAVTGFDGIVAASQSHPRLTTVAVPSAELGRRAVEMLAAAARDGEMPPSAIVSVQLVIGESTPRRTGVARPATGNVVAAVAGDRP